MKTVEDEIARLEELQEERTKEGHARRHAGGDFPERVHRMGQALIASGWAMQDPRLVALSAIELVEVLDAEILVAVDRYRRKRAT